LNIPLNPSWLIYDGSKTRWGDGSASAPVLLPALQEVDANLIQYNIGTLSNGQLAKTAGYAVSIANNLAGGAAGEVVYQTGVNQTGFTPVGTAGQLLQSNGSGVSPSWTLDVSPNTVVATGSSTARTLANRFGDIANILDFGADPTGVADSTTAIQNAITASGVGGTIVFPKGTFLLSSTLNGLSNQNFIGSGVNNTILYRTGDYGNTLYFANAGSAYINGIWFKHDNLPSVGYTTLNNKATTGSHVYFGNAQAATIEECWMWRLPFGVNVAQGSLIKINKCSIQGCWNRFASSAAQEGIASIYLGSSGYTQLVDITNCYFAGSNAGTQTITYTSSDKGAQSFTTSGTNAGSQVAIKVNTCEGLYVDGCYMGGQAFNNILFSMNGITSQIRITNNFFDGSGYDSPCLYFQPQSNGIYAVMVNIANNCFNGQLIGWQAIGSINFYGTQPTITGFQITGNTIANFVGSGVFLRRIQCGVISDNTISAYNIGDLSAGADPNFSCGIYVDNSSGTYIANNVLGGAINSALPNGSFCYQGAIIAGTNNQVEAKNNYFNGVGVSALNIGRIDKSIVVSTSNTTYTMTGDEELIVINNTGTNSIQITPPTNIPPGYTFTIKDGSGTASTYPLQLGGSGAYGTVDGVLNPVYSTNYVTKTITWNGTQWNVTGN
jgi:hypothetical protein